jgi:hypothetical protein
MPRRSANPGGVDSLRDEPELIAYVKAQEEHHRKTTFLEEYRKLLLDAGIKFEDKYFP